MPPAIPDRWIPYKACGKVIDGTRLICFKVPLKRFPIFRQCCNCHDHGMTAVATLPKYRKLQIYKKANVQTGKSEIKEIWDINALLQSIPKLGAVIDLTNTSRYYDPRELQAAGVLHKKILMPGRIIPPENKVQEFMDTVDEFMGKDCVAVQVKRARLGLSTTEVLIGVHCTHGLNRTGYMVCRYMRDRLAIPPKDAIKKFEKARGYQIERENYVADLLGKEPPPPDVGKHTDLKPMQERDERSYGPLRDGYKRYNNSSRPRRDSDSEGSWRREGQSSQEETRSKWSYSYKFDY